MRPGFEQGASEGRQHSHRRHRARRGRPEEQRVQPVVRAERAQRDHGDDVTERPDPEEGEAHAIAASQGDESCGHEADGMQRRVGPGERGDPGRHRVPPHGEGNRAILGQARGPEPVRQPARGRRPIGERVEQGTAPRLPVREEAQKIGKIACAGGSPKLLDDRGQPEKNAECGGSGKEGGRPAAPGSAPRGLHDVESGGRADGRNDCGQGA